MAYNSITQLLPDIYPEGEEVLEFVCAHAQHATKDWLCLPQLIYRNSGIHTDPRQNSPERGGDRTQSSKHVKDCFPSNSSECSSLCPAMLLQYSLEFALKGNSH